MKLSVFTLFLIFFQLSQLQSQVKPSIFPEDLNSEELESISLSKPGVTNSSRSKGLSITYGIIGDGAYHPEDDTNLTQPYSKYSSLQYLEFKLKIPIVLKDNFKMLIGLKHFSEKFKFKNIGDDFSFVFQELDSEKLKSNSMSIIVSKPMNSTQYTIMRLSYSADGDYNQFMSFDKKYSVYKFFGIYGFKKSDDSEWGLGLGATKSFRRTAALPFIMLNKNFNERWGIEAVIPIFVYARYNLNANNIFLVGFEYDSRSYRIDIDNSNFTDYAYAFNHSELIASVKLEHRFVPWFWGKMRLGYQMNFSSDFEAKSDVTTSFFAEPSNGLFFNVGFFVSPE